MMEGLTVGGMEKDRPRNMLAILL